MLKKDRQQIHLYVTEQFKKDIEKVSSEYNLTVNGLIKKILEPIIKRELRKVHNETTK